MLKKCFILVLSLTSFHSYSDDFSFSFKKQQITLDRDISEVFHNIETDKKYTGVIINENGYPVRYRDCKSIKPKVESLGRKYFKIEKSIECKYNNENIKISLHGLSLSEKDSETFSVSLSLEHKNKYSYSFSSDENTGKMNIY